MSPHRPSGSTSSYGKKNGDPFRQAAADTSIRHIRRENPFIILAAIIIAIVVGASLWISITALMEKMRLYHQLQQITDIIADARDAETGHRLDDKNQEDLIGTLGRGVTSRLRSVPGLSEALQKSIAEAVKSSGGSAIVELRGKPGSEAIVSAASHALAASASTVSFTAAAFVLIGLACTWKLPNPGVGRGDRVESDVGVNAA